MYDPDYQPKMTATTAFAQQSAGTSLNKPRELRLSERLDGIEGSLSELIGKLHEMHHRMSPSPETKRDGAPCAQGLVHSVGRIETALRDAHDLASILMNQL